MHAILNNIEFTISDEKKKIINLYFKFAKISKNYWFSLFFELKSRNEMVSKLSPWQ